MRHAEASYGYADTGKPGQGEFEALGIAFNLRNLGMVNQVGTVAAHNS